MPDTADRVADQAGRDAALDIGHSVIVQAPAGSGKTELLTQRFLKLLALVEHPEEVLAITFTRKAAGEMSDRVLQSLKLAAHDEEPDTPHKALTWRLARAVLRQDAELGWSLPEHPARLRIMTIDALNAALTRQMPLLARTGASLDVSAAPQALYDEAASAVVEMIARPFPVRAALETLIAHLDNDLQRTQRLLTLMLSRREQWLRHVLSGKQTVTARAELEGSITRMIGDELERTRRAIGDELLATVIRLGKESAARLHEHGRQSPILALHDLDELECGAASLPAWKGIVELLLTRQGGWRKGLNVTTGFPPDDRQRKEEMKALVGKLRERNGLLESLAIVRGLPDRSFSESQWTVLKALLEVLPLAAAQLELSFRRHGSVDYTAVARAALDALGESEAPTDLALALDYRIQHVLVDEFQDTSATQFELLKRLTAGWTPGDGRTLFCVGDPMQSIYRFREAEVSLFLRAWKEGIGDLALTPVRLSANFRAQASLVGWVNQTFPGIMPDEPDLQTAAVPFTRSDAVGEAIAGEAVRFHPIVTSQASDEARRVAEIVARERKEDAGVKIAVLVSGREHLRDIVPALREAGHSPQAVEIEFLDRRPVVHDLVALTSAMLHRGDRSAWLAVLRAPWCGLSLADLHALVSGMPGHTVPGLLEQDARQRRLSADGRVRTTKLLDALWPVLGQAGRAPVRRWVEAAWRRLGGPACVATKAELANAESFFQLLESFDQGNSSGDPSMLVDKLSELFARPDREADDNLQLMTVHKAKGLEFDVVILPGLDRIGGQEQPQLLRWMEIPRSGGALDLVLSPLGAVGEDPDVLHNYLLGLERRRKSLERGRLLYVAITRASRRVHLLGAVPLKREAEGGHRLGKPRANSMLATLWPVAEAHFDAALARRGRDDGTPAPKRAEARRQSLRRLPTGWRPPEPAPPATFRQALQPRRLISEEPVSFDWAGQTARLVGTVVHSALQQLALPRPGAGPLADIARLERPVRCRLSELGLRACDLGEAVELAMRAIGRTLSDERGRWILSNDHENVASELALNGAEGGIVQRVVIDRTFVDAEGRRWIIDYKVGTHEGRDLDAFFDEEVNRYREQLHRYAVFMSRFDPRPVRTALYFPVYAGWRDWDPFVPAPHVPYRDPRLEAG